MGKESQGALGIYSLGLGVRQSGKVSLKMEHLSRNLKNENAIARERGKDVCVCVYECVGQGRVPVQAEHVHV